MTPEERRSLVAQIPIGLKLEDVYCRKSNFLLAQNHPLTTPDWVVCVHLSSMGNILTAPGLYTADKAAQLRSQILEVSSTKSTTDSWCRCCGSPVACTAPERETITP